MVDLKSRIYKHFEVICVYRDLVLLLLNKRFAQIQGNSVNWRENPCRYQENTKNVETMVQQSYIWPETFKKKKKKTVSMDSDFQDLQGVEAI